MHILLVEDNRRLNQSLQSELLEEGFAVDAAYDGIAGEEMAARSPYDAIILDVMLPGRDGICVCRDLRDRRIRTPILMLTARDEASDRIRGLDSGADDYLVKPFVVDELRTRLCALVQCGGDTPRATALLRVADLTLDPVARHAQRAGRTLALSAKEFALLEYLMRNPGQPVTPKLVRAHAWNDEEDGAPNVVDVYMRRLRQKVDDPFEVKLLQVVNGSEYSLCNPTGN
jgi:two-component system, OmpR family, copper resistance phosphate regulon response regulator CusR